MYVGWQTLSSCLSPLSLSCLYGSFSAKITHLSTNGLKLAPRFRDPPHSFRHQAINSNQAVVLDIRFLKVSGSATRLVFVSWNTSGYGGFRGTS